MRLKRCIKNTVNSTEIYKIVNIQTGLFKEKGMCAHCTEKGGVWYKLGDVRKAFKIINEQDRPDYKIVKVKVKVKNIDVIN